MPEFDSMYGAESKAAFDAGQAPKGNTSHGNPFSGQGGNNQKKTTSTKADHTGKVISGIGFATNLNPIKALGTAYTWGKKSFPTQSWRTNFNREDSGNGRCVCQTKSIYR